MHVHTHIFIWMSSKWYFYKLKNKLFSYFWTYIFMNFPICIQWVSIILTVRKKKSQTLSLKPRLRFTDYKRDKNTSPSDLSHRTSWFPSSVCPLSGTDGLLLASAAWYPQNKRWALSTATGLALLTIHRLFPGFGSDGPPRPWWKSTPRTSSF